MRLMISFWLVLLTVVQSHALPRNLIVINGLGETADFVNLTDSTISRDVALLGLAPNDFLVSGTTGIVVNSSSADLYFFQLPAMTKVGTLFLGSGRNPYSGAFVDDDTMLITNLVASTVTEVDVVHRSIINEYNVGKSPEGITVIGDKAYICITNFDFGTFTYGHGSVQVFDANTNAVTKTILVGTNPQDLALGYDGYLYVVCTGDFVSQFGIIYKIDPISNTAIDSLSTGGSPGALAITRSGILFLAAGGFAGHGEIYTVDLNDFTLLRGPANPIFTDLGVTFVVAVSDSTATSCNFTDDTITEIDGSGKIIARFGTGDGPVAVAKFPACYLMKGDADGSGRVDLSDAVLLISIIFEAHPMPVNVAAGDMDCNAIISISDAVAVVNYVFGGVSLCGCAD